MEDKETFAHDILEMLNHLFLHLGVSKESTNTLEPYIYIAFIILIALGSTFIGKFFFNWLLRCIYKFKPVFIIKILLDKQLFSHLIRFILPITLLALAPYALENHASFLKIINIICQIGLIILFIIFSNAFFDALLVMISKKDKMRDKPLKGAFQIIQIFLIFVAIIAIISIIIHKPISGIMTGLGAFAAFLILIFRDTILGFVAGIQLSMNDMLRSGDWISMPKNDIDGIVIDATLYTVKIRNFDNTIHTIPPYELVSSSFQNWRGMTESGGRRIKQSFLITVPSIKNCTNEMLENYKKFKHLKEFIEYRTNIQTERQDLTINSGLQSIYGTTETNLGLFRAYIGFYLANHPLINQNLTCIIRLLECTNDGVPFEVFCFSTIKAWKGFEAVQSQIMEHIIITASLFNLTIYQNIMNGEWKKSNGTSL